VNPCGEFSLGLLRHSLSLKLALVLTWMRQFLDAVLLCRN
jgi:hypothetical protein